MDINAIFIIRAILNPFFYINLIRLSAYSFLIYALRLHRFNENVVKKFPQFKYRTDITIHRPYDCEIDHSVHFGRDTRVVFSPFSEVGKDTLTIKEGAYLCDRVELAIERHSNLRIGEHTYIRENSRIAGNVAIGNYCCIGQNVYVGAGAHIFNSEPCLYIRDQDVIFSEKNSGTFVEIHDDVFIGANVFVESNVVIGRGAIIGANSVVRKDVPPYSIAGSNGVLIGVRLDFKPPTHLHYMSDSSLPYLYSGIACNMKSALPHRYLGGLRFNSSGASMVMNLQNLSQCRLILKLLEPQNFSDNLTIEINGVKKNKIFMERTDDLILVNFELNSDDFSSGSKLFQKFDRIMVNSPELSKLMFVEVMVI
jgi:acetyltransferase-like isoleucine patch superfamily enzyme